jgi:glycosyltransferase involved in cell wall biosynthesis
MISVLMPTYNQAEYLSEALDGIRSQTCRDFELIVCDDCSTDDTPELLFGRATIRIRHTANRGTAAAINSAARFATGELMTWISSDNVMTPNWLERLAAEMTPDTGFVYSGFWDGETPTFRGYCPGALIRSEACYIGPSFLIRADVWREAGEHAGGISHDYGHWLRVEEVCWKHGLQIKAIPDKLCYYRRHDKMAGTRLMHLYDAPKHQDEARRRRELAR